MVKFKPFCLVDSHYLDFLSVSSRWTGIKRFYSGFETAQGTYLAPSADRIEHIKEGVCILHG